MARFLAASPETTRVLLAISVMLFASFAMTRITKLMQLPNVSGYIIAGILIGPSVLNLIPGEMLGHMGFISDIALTFIAFSVGQFFKKDVLKDLGGKIAIITVMESVLAGVLVTLSLGLIFKLDWNLALILGAIATATAPASTMMTIKQYKAKGSFVNILLQVVALDDAVCLLVYSAVVAVVEATSTGVVTAADVLLPVAFNLLSLGLGFLCGILLSHLMTDHRTRANRLILTVAMLTGISSLCALVDISPLLACMVLGTTYVNVKKDEQLFKQVDHFSPPIMSLFFVLSGMNLRLEVLKTVGMIGVAYFFIRILGKYIGAYAGCALTKVERPIRNYLGLALIPQAGVSIGLAVLTSRIMPGPQAELISTIILSSAVLYELIGPACAKLSLMLAGVIPRHSGKLPPPNPGEKG